MKSIRDDSGDDMIAKAQMGISRDFFPVGRDLTLPVDIERIRPSGPVGSIVAIPPDGVRTRGPDRPVFSFP